MNDDVIVIGAGVVGCAAAYFLAHEGVRVSVFDAGTVAYGASGRNAGVVEHPYDSAQEALYEETVSLLSEVLGPAMPAAPVGVLLVTETEPLAKEIAAGHRRFAALDPTLLGPAEIASAEPLLADDLWACRLSTGYPIQPSLAAKAYADRARELGVRFHLDTPVALDRDRDGVRGVRGVCGDREHDRAGAVLVAAGAASSEVIDPAGRWRPVRPLWGVSVAVDLPQHPQHVLLEGAVASIQTGRAPADCTAFSLIAAPGSLALGSTFLREKPAGEKWITALLSRGTRFCPLLGGAGVGEVLTCARPRSFDGRPLLGQVARQARLWLATGHGGRGISTGVASARIVAEALLSGDDDAIEAPLRADRFPE
ncbi:MAG: FAD-binding oxidoreductase [Actinomycetota bacterium]|nr:FAD-binding oxidoreductase [Actinomycetota bacterium]